MKDHDFEVVRKMLEEGMFQGGMHVALRDAGRLAGGMSAAGRLSRADLDALRSIAVDRSVNKTEGARKWAESVEYGRRQPVEAKRPDRGGALDWDSEIWIGEEPAATKPLIDQNYVESEELPEPANDWEGLDIARYLEVMFQPDEHVGLVSDSWVNDAGKHLPKRGVFDRTAAQLIEALRAAGNDYRGVIGDYDVNCGVWVRVNPLDGKGCKDENVTAYRHTLIEADSQDLGRQLALIRALQLPCSAVVHSGGKSIHALVRVDAETREQYRQRVEQLYSVCAKNGLKVDQACRNPSRLSRLPGVVRGSGCQYLIATRCGLPSWDEWVKWTEETTDSLPEITPLEDVFDKPANLAPELIEGVLRVGHKMRITGPSKAGKSFALIAMAAAIAEGRDWMGLKCASGKVLYINAELSSESFYERVRAVYRGLDWEPQHVKSISVWNLRGKTVPMEALIPSLIRRCRSQGFSVVIIDPIYKFNHGDENDAGQSSRFVNLLERVCTELGVSIIDCHHHSKGAQGHKSSMDRGSGSGVFARDPDAILDLIELMITPERREQLENQEVKAALEAIAVEYGLDPAHWPEDARQPADAAIMAFQQAYPARAQDAAIAACNAREAAERMTGWRIEATLREFAPLCRRNVLFRYPVHMPDTMELLTDAKASGEEAPWEAKQRATRAAKEAAKEQDAITLEKTIEALGGAGVATIKGVAETMGKSDKTVGRWVKSLGCFRVHKGLILDDDED